MSILVIDGMGGGLGAQIITQLSGVLPDKQIIAVGTNSTATANMVRAGAKKGATGINAVRVCLRDADCIIGPLGLVLADSMLGEITPEIAVMISSAAIPKVLIPVSHKNLEIIGLQVNSTMADLVRQAVRKTKELLDKQHS
ncbi:MAG: DUF3842 family protein [Clostridia bacterium]|nr:DUF3842 family protein [Clostridia bacterium]